MLLTFLRNQWKENAWLIPLLMILVMGLQATTAFAATAGVVPDVSGLSADTMLKRIAAQIPNLMRMVTAIAYVMGMFFMISGIIKLKHFGEMRTQMSVEHSLKGPLIFLAIGALLLYLPSSVQIGMSTFWTNPNPYGYLKQQNEWKDLIDTCFTIVQFVGVVAFIRGLLILTHIGGHHGQQGTLSRGLTHIIGGIFCINIYQFIQVIMNTLGIGYG